MSRPSKVRGAGQLWMFQQAVLETLFGEAAGLAQNPR